MVAFQFNDRFFQRGQTWRECLESWQHERGVFLKQVKHNHKLVLTEARLRQQEAGFRLAVVYSQHLRDARLALPAIGHTLDSENGLEVRFFWADVYFSVFYPFLKRPTFRLLQLDTQGHIVGEWGPRPALITRELQALELTSSRARDEWLARYDEARFLQALDASLADEFLQPIS